MQSTQITKTPSFSSADEYFAFYRKNIWNFVNDMMFDITFVREKADLKSNNRKKDVFIWDKLRDIVESVFSGNHTVVVSANGIGKTFIASVVVTAYLCLNPDSIVITTAPTWNQVEKLLWGEIRERFRTAKQKLVSCPINTTDIKISDKWYAVGLSTNEEERFQGFHAPKVLVVVDEASGVDRRIFKSIAGIVNSDDATLLAIGNPNNKDSRFYELTQLDGYNTIYIPATQHPNYKRALEIRAKYTPAQWGQFDKNRRRGIMRNANIIPGATTWMGCEQIGKDYGYDGPVYQVRVLAQFPDESDNQLISYAWIQNHLRNDEDEVNINIKVKGAADISRMGESETVFTYRRGAYVYDQIVWKKKDTRQTSDMIKMEVEDKFGWNYDAVTIDADGLGAGVYDNLAMDGMDVIDFHGGQRAENPDKFFNRRAELYWSLRMKLENKTRGTILLPDDPILHSQLCSLRFKTNSKGKIQIETKDEMLKRGIKSPDRADSLMMSEGDTYDVNDIVVGRDLPAFPELDTTPFGFDDEEAYGGFIPMW